MTTDDSKDKCPKASCPTTMLEWLATREPVNNLMNFLEGSRVESAAWVRFQPIAQYGKNKKEESWRLFQSIVTSDKTIFLRNILGAFNVALAKHSYTLKLEEGQTGIKGRVVVVKEGESGEALDPQTLDRLNGFVSNYLNKCVDEEFSFFVREKDKK